MVKSKFMSPAVDCTSDLLLVFKVWTVLWDNPINSICSVPTSAKILEPCKKNVEVQVLRGYVTPKSLTKLICLSIKQVTTTDWLKTGVN
jgi:hypothetical protein